MDEDNLQAQRFELKYQVREETALAVRNFVSSYLEIDEYGATQPNLSYPVHSLYLDSDDLTLYWHTFNGNKNRYKLRLRYYESRPTAPIYFEIKRRMNEAILKQRGAVRREAVEWLLAGHLPERSHLVSNEPKQYFGVYNFCQLMNSVRAKPTAHVAYVREAWISPQNNSVRVTMDRQIRFERQPLPIFSTEMRKPVYAFPLVVLELKFTGRFPNWFRELVRVFGLAQCAAAKYADGLALYGAHHFGGRRFSPLRKHDLEGEEENAESPDQASPKA
jgi:hypothetical protein